MKNIQSTVNWGIIGAGNVCEKKSGPAFSKAPNSDLIAIMRRDKDKAEDYARRHNVKKYYTNASKLISDPEINAIYIATPPVFHEQYAIEAMKAGKAVYIEKPATLDAIGCERLIEEARKQDVPVSVAHYRRALPLFQKVKSIVREGILGKITMINLQLFQPVTTQLITKTDDNWRLIPSMSGGGLFHDLAPHQLDILFWIFGEASDISGFSLNQSNPGKAPDFAKLNMIFNPGIVFTGVWSFSVHNSTVRDSCAIAGKNGRVVFPFFGNPTLNLHTDAMNEYLPFDQPEHIQQPHIENVVKYFRGEGANPCSLEDALQSMRMIDATSRE
ncbi:MAG: Gfo/Idh/MocA family oxidoreductase [Bacteroidales bacterium]|nr:Gfo/Idh/MocA family oxidoreductase [Bacteroidales bacterium]